MAIIRATASTGHQRCVAAASAHAAAITGTSAARRDSILPLSV